MSAVLSLLASPIFGSITGFLGSWLTKKEERKLKELDYKHAEAMAQMKNQQEILVAEKKLAGVIEEGKIVIQSEEMKAFTASQERSSTFGEKVKNMMRAALICYVSLVCGLLTWMIYRQIGGLDSMSTAALVSLFGETVSMFFYMFSLGYSWFYGIRGSSSQKAKEAR